MHRLRSALDSQLGKMASPDPLHAWAEESIGFMVGKLGSGAMCATIADASIYLYLAPSHSKEKCMARASLQDVHVSIQWNTFMCGHFVNFVYICTYELTV